MRNCWLSDINICFPPPTKPCVFLSLLLQNTFALQEVRSCSFSIFDLFLSAWIKQMRETWPQINEINLNILKVSELGNFLKNKNYITSHGSLEVLEFVMSDFFLLPFCIWAPLSSVCELIESDSSHYVATVTNLDLCLKLCPAGSLNSEGTGSGKSLNLFFKKVREHWLIQRKQILLLTTCMHINRHSSTDHSTCAVTLSLRY